jgi:hypothetical protein
MATPLEPAQKVLTVSEYDPETMMRPDMTIVCVGQRGSGKTVLMQWLLYCMRSKLDFVAVFCPTVDTLKTYAEHVPRCCLHDNVSPAKLAAICDAQSKIHKVIDAPGSGKKSLRYVGIIMDDCMHDKKKVNCEAMRYLFMNGRHDNLFYINAVQYIMGLNKDMRSQIDLAIVFPRYEASFCTALRENLLGDCFETDDEMRQTFRTLQPYEALVYDARAQRAGKPCLFFLKAPITVPPFRVGSDHFWRLCYKHTKPFSIKAHQMEIFQHVAAMTRGGGGGGGGGCGGRRSFGMEFLEDEGEHGDGHGQGHGAAPAATAAAAAEPSRPAFVVQRATAAAAAAAAAPVAAQTPRNIYNSSPPLPQLPPVRQTVHQQQQQAPPRRKPRKAGVRMSLQASAPLPL